ncbi:alpha/beta fold hydrolase [Chitinophaga flava]|nr:alpha/beta hydrolase [Chitinophaga flava]
MNRITVKDGTEIYYKDWGTGQPLVFHHGWPLSSDDWDAQMIFFLNQGFRVIAFDRRGHGRSSQTGIGHDMDTYAFISQLSYLQYADIITSHAINSFHPKELKWYFLNFHRVSN